MYKLRLVAWYVRAGGGADVFIRFRIIREHHKTPTTMNMTRVSNIPADRDRLCPESTLTGIRSGYADQMRPGRCYP